MISVSPVQGGWMVRSNLADNPMMFASGPAAEAAARRLAERLARAGEAVKIHVHMKDGALAARFVCPPWPQAPFEPAPAAAPRPAALAAA